MSRTDVRSLWPADPVELAAVQRALAASTPEPLGPVTTVGAVAVCAGDTPEGERLWAAAVLRGAQGGEVVVSQPAPAPYRPGELALREGPIRSAAVLALPGRPDVLLVDAAGRDHPRGAGLALHLGAVLDLPTVGVTERPLLARGPLPGPRRGATAPLYIGDRLVAYWVRTRTGVRPLVVHAGWHTSPDEAVEVVLGAGGRMRWPEVLRQARRLARNRRSADLAGVPPAEGDW